MQYSKRKIKNFSSTAETPMTLTKKQIEKAIIDHFGSRIYYRVCVKSAIKVKELELAEFIHKLLRVR